MPPVEVPKPAVCTCRDDSGASSDCAIHGKVVVPPVDRSNLCTTNGKPVEEVRAGQTNETGMHEGYIVLCDAERAKGFVRPYRNRYQHVGLAVCGSVVRLPSGSIVLPPIKICTDAPGHTGDCGIVTREVSAEQFDQIKMTRQFGGCGTVTTMGRQLSETYARDPKFYGSTFCVKCDRHLPVGEFIWTADGQVVGS